MKLWTIDPFLDGLPLEDGHFQWLCFQRLGPRRGKIDSSSLVVSVSETSTFKDTGDARCYGACVGGCDFLLQTAAQRARAFSCAIL